MLSQLHSPVLYRLGTDISYQFVYKSHLATWLTAGFLRPLLFDLCLFATCFSAILWPANKILKLCFAMLFLLYCIIFNIFLTHSIHYSAILVIGCYCLLWDRPEMFEQGWKWTRIIICFTYVEACVWKFQGGAFWQWDAGIELIKINQAFLLHQFPQTIKAQLLEWFLQQPFIINAGQKLIFISEGIFILGFITKRFDRLLILLILFIHLSICFFLGTYFYEQLGAILFFLPDNFWHKCAEFAAQVSKRFSLV